MSGLIGPDGKPLPARQVDCPGMAHLDLEAGVFTIQIQGLPKHREQATTYAVLFAYGILEQFCQKNLCQPVPLSDLITVLQRVAQGAEVKPLDHMPAPPTRGPGGLHG